VREKHERPAGTAAIFFHKKTRELARQMAELRDALPPDTPASEIALADAREARLRTPVALVLTSPPYPSTYDYLPMQHLRLVWLGGGRTSREIGARRLGAGISAQEIWRRDAICGLGTRARAGAGGHLV
jgi:hypothetical protein